MVPTIFLQLSQCQGSLSPRDGFLVQHHGECLDPGYKYGELSPLVLKEVGCLRQFLGCSENEALVIDILLKHKKCEEYYCKKSLNYFP